MTNVENVVSFVLRNTHRISVSMTFIIIINGEQMVRIENVFEPNHYYLDSLTLIYV